jgi:ubiquitin-like modifier-activating enzyme ATG7
MIVALLARLQSSHSTIMRAINEKGYVEEVSGLAEVQRRAEEMDNDVDWQSDGEEDNEEAEIL